MIVVSLQPLASVLPSRLNASEVTDAFHAAEFVSDRAGSNFPNDDPARHRPSVRPD